MKACVCAHLECVIFHITTVVYLSPKISYTWEQRNCHPSARPEVRGTADVDGGAYLPFHPLSRTPSRLSSFRSTGGRTGTDRTCGRTRTLFAHHFTCRLWRWGWCTSRAPYDHLIRPPT